MTQWTKEFCSEKPDQLQIIAPGLYIQRMDIFQDVDGGWSCMSREITVSEYCMLQSIAEIDAHKAIDAYTMQLIEEGVL